MPKGKVLVVEDQPDWRDDLVEMLEDDGYDVDSVATFRQAKEKLQTARYDVITVDLVLEEGSDDEGGKRVLRYIQQNHPRMRCIVISGSISDTRKMRELFVIFGAVDAFSKQDFPLIEFLSKVEEAVQEAQAEDAAALTNALTDIDAAGDAVVVMAADSSPQPDDTVRIFISYKHDEYDESILRELLDYMSPVVQQAGGMFWYDKNIQVGDAWDDVIHTELARTDIALLLISQAYLGSEYIQEVELASVKERRQQGLIIFPIILTSCLWDTYDWLSQTQFMPTDGTIDVEYNDRGRRNRLYKEITQQLLRRIQEVRDRRRIAH